MKKILSVALAATAFVASPAMAQDAASTFTGPRIGANVGFFNDNVVGFDTFSYGLEAGYDFDAGGAVVGLTAEIQDAKSITRELGLTARAGAKVGSNGLLYATGGYTNLRGYGVTIDGFKVGVGGEVAFGKGYGKLEQLYYNYGSGADLWQTRLGFGVRF